MHLNKLALLALGARTISACAQLDLRLAHDRDPVNSVLRVVPEGSHMRDTAGAVFGETFGDFVCTFDGKTVLKVRPDGKYEGSFTAQCKQGATLTVSWRDNDKQEIAVAYQNRNGDPVDNSVASPLILAPYDTQSTNTMQQGDLINYLYTLTFGAPCNFPEA